MVTLPAWCSRLHLSVGITKCYIQGIGQHVTSLRLYNALGQQLLMRTFSKKETSAIIDLAPHSKSGILFAKLESNGKSIVRKFILDVVPKVVAN